jgi:hypothetical protein
MISDIYTTTSYVDPSYTTTTNTDVTDTTTETDSTETSTDTVSELLDATESTSETDSTDQQTTSDSTDNVSLSTRAQKLNLIANEFFTSSSIDMDELVERIYEYGLITDTQYSALGGGEEASTGDSATDSVIEYIGNLTENLSELSDEQTFNGITLAELKEALNDSKDIILNVSSTEMSSSLSQSIAENKLVLAEVYDSEEFGEMSEDDQLTMASVIKTLSVIEALSSYSSTSTQTENSLLSSYLDVSQY